MPALIVATRAECLAPGKGAVVTVGSNTVALFKAEDAIHAIEGRCLRCGACLADGRLHGRIVACCGCDWRYDIGTGSVLGIPALRLIVFDVKVVDGQIVVAYV